MPRATPEQVAKINELNNRGFSRVAICRRAGLHGAAVSDFTGVNGIGVERIGKLMSAVDAMLGESAAVALPEAPPPQNASNHSSEVVANSFASIQRDNPPPADPWTAGKRLEEIGRQVHEICSALSCGEFAYLCEIVRLRTGTTIGFGAKGPEDLSI